MDREQRTDLDARRRQRHAITTQRPTQRRVRGRNVLDGEQTVEPGGRARDEFDPRVAHDASHAAQHVTLEGEHVQSTLVPRLHADEQRLGVPRDPRQVLDVRVPRGGREVEHAPLPRHDVDERQRDERVGRACERVGEHGRLTLGAREVSEMGPTHLGLVDTRDREPRGAGRPPHPAQTAHLLGGDELGAPPYDAGLLDESPERRLVRIEVEHGHPIIVMQGDAPAVRRDARIERRHVERDDPRRARLDVGEDELSGERACDRRARAVDGVGGHTTGLLTDTLPSCPLRGRQLGLVRAERACVEQPHTLARAGIEAP